jgi:hypothetical protein
VRCADSVILVLPYAAHEQCFAFWPDEKTKLWASIMVQPEAQGKRWKALCTVLPFSQLSLLLPLQLLLAI